MITKISFKKATIVEGLVIALMIVLVIKLLSIFNINEVWPASIALLFFFEGKTKIGNIKNIFCGGTAGLLLSMLLMRIIDLVTQIMAIEAGILLTVFIFIFLIIILGNISPLFFNNYTFCYFTIASIFGTQQLTLNWIIGLLGGGGVLICSMAIFLRHLPDHKAESEEPLSE